MRRKRYFRSWLLAPPLSGKLAIACTFTAIAVPTLLMVAIRRDVMAVSCLVYCPFVLLTAILAGWRPAAFAAVGSSLACDYFFMGTPPRLFEDMAEWYTMAIFLGYCAMIIGLVLAVRKMVGTFPRRADPDEESSGIIFSLENGQAWASWTGGDAPVPLGPCDEVAEMMEDFLAQIELGKRLTAKTAVRR